MRILIYIIYLEPTFLRMIFKELNWGFIDVIIALTSLVCLLKTHFGLFVYLVGQSVLILVHLDVIKSSNVILLCQLIILDLSIPS